MLLNSLKKQILRKKIDSKLRKVDSQLKDKSMPIKTVGCLIDGSLISNLSYFRELSSVLNVHTNNIFMLTYNDDKKAEPYSIGLTALRTSISWKSDIVSDDAKEFMSRDYDLLINYFKKSNSVLGLISAHTNAFFRVGFETIDNRFNDLIFSSQMLEKDIFKIELERYLKIMNKI
jgi:hypothetical protein